MTQLLTRPVLRALLIATVTWLLASALLLPQYNPFTRGRMQAAEQLGMVWSELTQWKVFLTQAVMDEGTWPRDLQTYTPPGTHGLLQVSSPAPYQLSLRIAQRSELGELAGKELLQFDAQSRQWHCRAGSPPIPARLLPLNCDSARGTAHDPFGWLRTLLLLCVLVFVVTALLWLLRHPLIGPAQLRPERLRHTPLARLALLDRLLRCSARRSAALASADIRMHDWQQALHYAQALADGQTNECAEMLAERLSAHCRPAEGWDLPGAVFLWQLPSDMPMALDRCLCYLPAPSLDEATLLRRLRALSGGTDVLLVCSSHSVDAPQPQLQRYCADPTNACVMLDSADQTAWLLAPDARQKLLQLLTRQLPVTRISPYQTRGGVTREDVFFGRTQLLARILGREPGNYLIVGGRQLGKSSLLKALQRRLVDHPNLHCHYVSLRDHRLAPRLAAQWGLDVHTPLEQVIAHLQAQDPSKRVWLLIDEADLFFRDQAQNGYAELAALRTLSDEGRCFFILAGFWELHAAVALDYQSPLRNFGEVLTIGGLEETACLALASEPLQRLRIGYGNDQLVRELVHASGLRANLVAILCQECLHALAPSERVIQPRHLEQAIASQAVRDALAGWGRLSHDAQACRFDRIAIYDAILCGRTSLEQLSALLQAHALPTHASALQEALTRLQLAYVLRRHTDGFRFAVPLLAQQFESAETRLLLEQELQALAAA